MITNDSIVEYDVESMFLNTPNCVYGAHMYILALFDHILRTFHIYTKFLD
jgi:hypothetical protein